MAARGTSHQPSAKIFRPWEQTSEPTPVSQIGHLPIMVQPIRPVQASPPVQQRPPVQATPPVQASPSVQASSPYCYPSYLYNSYPVGYQWPTLCSPPALRDDSGYLSELSPTDHTCPLDLSTKDRQAKPRRALNPAAVAAMERWYHQNLHHPYPSEEIINLVARTGDITPAQVRKWMANKRVRSQNTMCFNQAAHSRRPRAVSRKKLYAQADSTSERTPRPQPYPTQSSARTSERTPRPEPHPTQSSARTSERTPRPEPYPTQSSARTSERTPRPEPYPTQSSARAHVRQWLARRSAPSSPHLLPSSQSPPQCLQAYSSPARH